MPILNSNCFTSNYLQEKHGELRSRDIKIFEKSILALELVGRLQKEGLNFIFKGGTSLMLLLDAPRRLSIDVDILCLEPLDQLKSVLERITGEAPFTSWEHQELRDREAPPTKHFQIYYDSSVSSDSNTRIQIDVTESESPYANIEDRSLDLNFIDLIEDIHVPIPTASSLLGDKLATFSPSTIGYLYESLTRTGVPAEPRPIKVVKHLFDLGELATMADNFSETIETYQNIHAEQNRFRESDYSIGQCLDDTQDAAFWVARDGGRNLPDEPKIEFLSRGVRALNSHLLASNFRRPEARTAAGRATLIAEAIRQGDPSFSIVNFLETGLDIEYLKTANLDGQWADLNRLKRTDINAFACWEMAQQIRHGRTQ